MALERGADAAGEMEERVDRRLGEEGAELLEHLLAAAHAGQPVVHQRHSQPAPSLPATAPGAVAGSEVAADAAAGAEAERGCRCADASCCERIADAAAASGPGPAAASAPGPAGR